MFALSERLLFYMQAGGFVMWPLAIATCVLWYALGYRFFLLRRGTSLALPLLWKSVQKHPKNRSRGVLDYAALRSYELFCQEPPALLRAKLEELNLSIKEQLSRYALAVKILVVLAPLAGLLGTVCGMIETFDALGEMSLFDQSGGGIAGGISQALISTQMGLAVAIPGLLVGRLLQRREERMEQEVDQWMEFCLLQLPEPTKDRALNDSTMQSTAHPLQVDSTLSIQMNSDRFCRRALRTLRRRTFEIDFHVFDKSGRHHEENQQNKHHIDQRRNI